jgi:hypothetical protein
LSEQAGNNRDFSTQYFGGDTRDLYALLGGEGISLSGVGVNRDAVHLLFLKPGEVTAQSLLIKCPVRHERRDRRRNNPM